MLYLHELDTFMAWNTCNSISIQYIIKVIELVAYCIISPHSTISQRALQFFLNQSFIFNF